jgi:hypothetical protein
MTRPGTCLFFPFYFSLIILPHPLAVCQIHVSSLVGKIIFFLHMLAFLKKISGKKNFVKENEASFEIFWNILFVCPNGMFKIK